MTNLDRMRQIDDAWNARDWAVYEALLAPDLQAWMQGDADPHGRAEHVRRAREFFARVPDNRVVVDPYIAAFDDGDLTCVVATLAGSRPDGAAFETRFATVCRWRNGQITKQYEFIDHRALASADS